MTLEARIALALDRAKRIRLDPAVLVTEVYLDELLRLFQESLGPYLVWKGGTVLRLLGSPRYSRDLDATLSRAGTEATGVKIQRAVSDASRALPFSKRHGFSRDRMGAGFAAGLHFRVPGLKLPLKIGMEVSTREPPLLPTEWVSTARISHPLGTKPVVVLRLSDSELVAEKLRALLMRRAPRDLMDLHFCIQKGMKVDRGVFLKKMRFYAGRAFPFDLEGRIRDTQAFLKRLGPDRLRLQLANLLAAEAERFDFAVILEDVRAELDRLARA